MIFIVTMKMCTLKSIEVFESDEQLCLLSEGGGIKTIP